MIRYEDYKNDVLKGIIVKCEEIGYVPKCIKFKSSHLDDMYLFVVMGIRLEDERCAVWTYNQWSQCLCNGIYELDFDEASKEFNESGDGLGYKFITDYELKFLRKEFGLD